MFTRLYRSKISPKIWGMIWLVEDKTENTISQNFKYILIFWGILFAIILWSNWYTVKLIFKEYFYDENKII